MVVRLIPRAFAVAFAVVVWIAWYGGGSPVDAIAYWTVVPDDPYVVRASAAYVYPPAFAQAIAPLLGLPFETFVAVVRAGELAALYALVGPLLPLVFLLSPVASDVNAGNVNIMLTAAAWYGLRHPAAWSFAFVTKPSVGVGVLWHAFRGEWRSLAAGLGVTAAVVGISFVAAPAAWLDYPRFLREFDPVSPSWLALRLVLAVPLLAWGARTGRAWVVPVVVLLALPRWYLMSPCVLVPLANRDAWRRLPARHAPRLPSRLALTRPAGGTA